MTILDQGDMKSWSFWGMFIRIMLVLCWVAPVMFLSSYAVENASMKLVILCFLAIFVPTSVGMFYVGTVNKIERLQSLRDGGKLRNFISSRIFTAILAFLGSAFVAFTSVFWFFTLSQQERVALLLSVFVYVIVIRVVEPLVASEMKPFVARKNTLSLGGWLFATAMALIFCCYQLLLLDGPQTTPLAVLVDDIFSAPATVLPQSLLIQTLGQWAQVLDATQIYFLGQLMVRENAFGLLTFPLYWLLFFSFAQLISPFFLERAELRRIAVPLSEAEIPEVPVGRQLIAPSAWATIAALVCILSFLDAEERARYSALKGITVSARPIVLILAEQIDSRYYKPGTSDALVCSKLALYDHSEEALDALRTEVAVAFSSMRGNVDAFLDAYYSLPAEYLRLAQLAVGTLESQLSSDLQQTLEDGDPFGRVDDITNFYFNAHNEASRLWRQERGAILAANELDISPSDRVVVTERYSLTSLSQPPSDIDVIGFRGRATSAGIAGASAVVATKVVGKVAGKNVFKAAAQAMGKVALSKVGGAAAGGALGAGLGSVVPVFGTMIGGVVGAGIGLGVSLFADFALLKLDEYYSRPEFKRQIMDAINDKESNLLSQLTSDTAAQGACKSNSNL